jgi:hypothetical protein
MSRLSREPPQPHQGAAIFNRRLNLVGGFKPPFLEAARRSIIPLFGFRNSTLEKPPAHILLLLKSAMNTLDQTSTLSDTIIDSHRLITGLRHALDVDYARVLAAAQTRWEQNFAGKDPSDSCVSVRIRSGKPLAGILKKSSKSLLHGGHRLLA